MRSVTSARYQGKHVKPALHPTRSTMSAGLTAVLLPLCMASPALAEGEPTPTASPISASAEATPSAEATTSPAPSESPAASSEATASPDSTSQASTSPASTEASPAESSPAASPTASAAPAAAPAKATTEVRISGPRSVVAPGSHTIGVRLLADGHAVKDGYVRLERKDADGSWTYIGRLLTRADGLGSGKLSFTRSTRIRAVYQGSSSRTADVSPEIVVRVASFRLRALQVAAAQNGDPYRYGSTGPDSFDCSGLVKYSFAQAGKALPRTSGEMYRATQHISASQKQPGDLIFMSHNGRIGHVGVYAGNGMMWDAPTAGRTVSKRRIYSASYYVGRVN